MSSAQSLVLSMHGEEAEHVGARREQRFDCRDGSIGRADDCDWVLGAQGVSRLHALVRYLNGLYFIEDRSTNGMSLNGASLKRGEPAALKHGDRLRIDSFEIDVKLAGESAAQFNALPDHERAVSTAVPASIDARSSSAATPAAYPDALDPSLLLAPPRDAAPNRAGYGEGLIPGAVDAEPGAGLDPLAMFGASPSYAEHPQQPHPPAESWNHTPAFADRFRPPRVEAARASAAMLPDDWNTSGSRALSRVGSQRDDPAPACAPPAASASQAEATPKPTRPPPAPKPTPAAEPAAAPTPTPVALRTSQELEDMLHIAVDAMMDVLRARAELKNTFRLPATLIQRSENNPLKFAPSAQEAVRKLFAPPDEGFLRGRAALDDAAAEIRNHQMAMLAGVRSAFQSMLAHFDPARIEASAGDRARRLPFGARPRHWERYKARFEALTGDPDECFRRLFGDEFARAYEDQLARLKSRRD